MTPAQVIFSNNFVTVCYLQKSKLEHHVCSQHNVKNIGNNCNIYLKICADIYADQMMLKQIHCILSSEGLYNQLIIQSI